VLRGWGRCRWTTLTSGVKEFSVSSENAEAETESTGEALWGSIAETVKVKLGAFICLMK